VWRNYQQVIGDAGRRSGARGQNAEAGVERVTADILTGPTGGGSASDAQEIVTRSEIKAGDRARDGGPARCWRRPSGRGRAGRGGAAPAMGVISLRFQAANCDCSEGSRQSGWRFSRSSRFYARPTLLPERHLADASGFYPACRSESAL
jgi:hypothetical protein